MVECNYCGTNYKEGTGYTRFKKDGTAIHYCSRKCDRNADLKRKPANLKWTKAGGNKA